MPSNKDLSKQALNLAEKLKIVVITAGLNNVELSKLVTDLKAKAKDAENDTIADGAESTDETTGEGTTDAAGDETEDEVEAYPYSIKAGKSVTSKRGILGEGEEVKAEDLPGGKETLEDLIVRGFVEEG